MAKPRWDLPLPNYERDVNSTRRVYRSALQEVIGIIESLSTHGKSTNAISKAQLNSVKEQLSATLIGLDAEIDGIITDSVGRAFVNGQGETILALGDADSLQAAIAGASMSELATTTSKALIADTFEDLLFANNKMKRETIKMVRNIAAEQMKTTVVAGQGVNYTKKKIVERFREQGDIAIVDNLGRKWKLERYSEMVTRTKLMQAHVEGTRTEALERGVDLAIISSHGATDACSGFEGQIISMNGTTEGYMTYDELRRSNLIFHPNCKHKITPLRDTSLLPDNVLRKFENGRQSAENRLKSAKRNK